MSNKTDWYPLHLFLYSSTTWRALVFFYYVACTTIPQLFGMYRYSSPTWRALVIRNNLACQVSSATWHALEFLTTWCAPIWLNYLACPDIPLLPGVHWYSSGTWRALVSSAIPGVHWYSLAIPGVHWYSSTVRSAHSKPRCPHVFVI